MEPLPDDLVARPRRTTLLRRSGVSRWELDGPLWRRLDRGVRAWAGVDPDDPDVRMHACAAAHPDAVLGGWMALRAAGLRDFDGLRGLSGRLQPALVHVGPAGRARPTAVVHVDRGALEPADVVDVEGLRVLVPTAAVVGIARRYGAEEGLVAADAAWRAGLTSREDLAAYVRPLRGARGIRSARLVVELASPRAESLPESRLRFIWVVEAGLPAPLVNPVVLDASGRFVGRSDLLDPDAATVGEYDGAYHRDADQHAADNAREEDFEGLNLTVVRATAQDIWGGRHQLVRRLVLGRARGLARDRRRDRFCLAEPGERS